MGEKKVADAYRTSFSENGTRVLSDRRARAPKSDLDRVRDIQLHQDCFMSPYLASDEMFRQLPPLGIAVRFGLFFVPLITIYVSRVF